MGINLAIIFTRIFTCFLDVVDIASDRSVHGVLMIGNVFDIPVRMLQATHT